MSDHAATLLADGLLNQLVASLEREKALRQALNELPDDADYPDDADFRKAVSEWWYDLAGPALARSEGK